MTTKILEPEQTHKCSACSELFRESAPASDDTLEDAFWSDGKLEGSMFLKTHHLVRCPHCSTLVWINEQEVVGSSFSRFFEDDEDDELSETKDYLIPTASDYESTAPAWAHDSEKCLYLRVHAWWGANDARRRNEQPAPFSEGERRNVEGLIEMLDESYSNERFFKAEALRELGRFAEALRLLAQNTDTDPRSEQAVTIIRELATKGDIFVRALPWPL